MTTKTRKERVIFIEYQDAEDYKRGRPFSALSLKPHRNHDGTWAEHLEIYDVEWCKRDGECYVHNSGSGGDRDKVEVYGNTGGTTHYWAAPGIKVKRGNKAKVTRVSRARGRKALEAAMEGGCSDGFNVGETEYCPTCNDYLPCEDTDEICEHVWYCEDACGWSKPGERCPWDCEECREDGRETAPPSPLVAGALAAGMMEEKWLGEGDEPGPPPPMLALAVGYALALSPLAAYARAFLAKRGLTPRGLAIRICCQTWGRAARAALAGRIHKDVSRYRLAELAQAFAMDAAERAELFGAFGMQEIAEGSTSTP